MRRFFPLVVSSDKLMPLLLYNIDIEWTSGFVQPIQPHHCLSCPKVNQHLEEQFELTMSRGNRFWIVFLALVATLFSLNAREVSAFTSPTRRSITSSHTSFQRTSSHLASTVIERPQEKEKVVEILNDKTVEEENKYGGEGWEIRLWNDPFNKREFVARCLSTICGKSDTESYQIMMQAHNNGMGVIGRYNLEIAEVYHNSLKENGLTVDMVQVDDE